MDQVYIEKSRETPLIEEIGAVFADLDNTWNKGKEIIEAYIVKRYTIETGDTGPLQEMEKMMKELFNPKNYNASPEKRREIRQKIRGRMDDIIDQIPVEFLDKEDLYDKLRMRSGIEELIEYGKKNGVPVIGISMGHPYMCQHFSQEYGIRFVACRNDEDKKLARQQICEDLGIEPYQAIDIGDGEQDWLGKEHSSIFIQVGNMHDRINGCYDKVDDFTEIKEILSKAGKY